jgi:allophanate hydrolase
MKAVIEIEAAGPLTTIQDEGRKGLMRFGVPASGPMDRTAYAIAQEALGNAPGAGSVEVSLGGLTLRCIAGPVTIATAGGGFRVTLDGEPIPSWGVATLQAGARLTIQAGFWGTWTYLAFAGRLLGPSWLGSSATHLRSGLGGGALKPGTRLAVETSATGPRPVGPLVLPVTARPRREIRVVLGPQDHFFPPDSIARFLSEPYALTSSYDRRLSFAARSRSLATGSPRYCSRTTRPPAAIPRSRPSPRSTSTRSRNCARIRSCASVL